MPRSRKLTLRMIPDSLITPKHRWPIRKFLQSMTDHLPHLIETKSVSHAILRDRGIASNRSRSSIMDAILIAQGKIQHGGTLFLSEDAADSFASFVKQNDIKKHLRHITVDRTPLVKRNEKQIPGTKKSNLTPTQILKQLKSQTARTREIYSDKVWRHIADEYLKNPKEQRRIIAEHARTSETYVSRIAGLFNDLFARIQSKGITRKQKISASFVEVEGKSLITGVPALDIHITRDVHGHIKKVEGIKLNRNKAPAEGMALVLGHFLDAWNKRK